MDSASATAGTLGEDSRACSAVLLTPKTEGVVEGEKIEVDEGRGARGTGQMQRECIVREV